MANSQLPPQRKTVPKDFYPKLLLIRKKLVSLPPLTSNGLSCGVMVTQQILVLSFWVRVPAAQLTWR